MKVLITPEAKRYLTNLITILYENEYFGFKDSAKNYVVELRKDIEINLPTRPHKPATQYFDKYGKDMLYAAFRKNKQTTWYAFFTKYNENGNTFYLVRYIANNHTVAQYL